MSLRLASSPVCRCIASAKAQFSSRYGQIRSLRDRQSRRRLGLLLALCSIEVVAYVFFLAVSGSMLALVGLSYVSLDVMRDLSRLSALLFVLTLLAVLTGFACLLTAVAAVRWLATVNALRDRDNART